MEKNTPQLWDKIWGKSITAEEANYELIKEENSIRWQRIERIIVKEFGKFENLQVIEIGAGSGTNASLMAKRGANVTILDYSEKALKRAREFFECNQLCAKYIKGNALSLSDELLGKYDVSMSFGLTEHFQGIERVNINKAHFDLLRKGGISFISVPNRYNLPYRIYKYLAEHTGRWSVGEEYPYSRKEFINICKQIGIREYSFLGDSLFESFRFINPLKVTRLGKMFRVTNNINSSFIKKKKALF